MIEFIILNFYENFNVFSEMISMRGGIGCDRLVFGFYLGDFCDFCLAFAVTDLKTV